LISQPPKLIVLYVDDEGMAGLLLSSLLSFAAAAAAASIEIIDRHCS